MTLRIWKYALAAVAASFFASTAGFVSNADAMGCGCCGGKKMSGKAKSSGGCMGGAAAKDGKGGMSCMKGMGNMSMAQKASDEAMMKGMDHSKMDMSGMDHSKMDMSGGDNTSADANPDVTFAKEMIPHHESAIEMAENLLKNGKDPDLKKMAEEIIAVQKKEIKALYGWLAKNAE